MTIYKNLSSKFCNRIIAAEILAVTGKTPSERYKELEAEFGAPLYKRIDAPANATQKAKLKALSAADVTADTLAGDKIVEKLTEEREGDTLVVWDTNQQAWRSFRYANVTNVTTISGENIPVT